MSSGKANSRRARWVSMMGYDPAKIAPGQALPVAPVVAAPAPQSRSRREAWLASLQTDAPAAFAGKSAVEIRKDQVAAQVAAQTAQAATPAVSAAPVKMITQVLVAPVAAAPIAAAPVASMGRRRTLPPVAVVRPPPAPAVVAPPPVIVATPPVAAVVAAPVVVAPVFVAPVAAVVAAPVVVAPVFVAPVAAAVVAPVAPVVPPVALSAPVEADDDLPDDDDDLLSDLDDNEDDDLGDDDDGDAFDARAATKAVIVERLCALPEWAGKESSLMSKKKDELVQLYESLS